MRKIENKKKLMKDLILGDIAKGLYKSGGKLPSERVFADNHGISRATTRKALLELQSEGILSCRETVGYFVTSEAGKLINGNSGQEYSLRVGLVFQPKRFVNPLFTDFFNELTNIINPEIKLTTYFHSFLKPEIYIEDELDVIVAGEDFVKSDLLELQDHKMEVVLLNQVSDEFNYITTDNYKSGCMMLENLVRNGHKNVFCIKIPNLPENDEMNLRAKGIHDAALKFGVKVSFKKLAYYQVIDNINQYAADITTSDREITAFCAIAGTLAINLYQFIEDNGLRIPEDISLIGFDDCAFNPNLKVPMTAIRQPHEKIAAKLAEWLQNLMNGNKVDIKENIEPTLIERNSVKCLKEEKTTTLNSAKNKSMKKKRNSTKRNQRSRPGRVLTS